MTGINKKKKNTKKDKNPKESAIKLEIGRLRGRQQRPNLNGNKESAKLGKGNNKKISAKCSDC